MNVKTPYWFNIPLPIMLLVILSILISASIKCQSIESLACASKNQLFHNIGEPVIGIANADNDIMIYQGFVQVIGQDALIKPLMNEQRQISIFPNPTADIIYITHSNNNKVKLRLFNPIGQEIEIKETHKNLSSIDMTNYESGIYFLAITIEDKIINVKPIIKI